jgi:trans-aconitate methyltransferase
MSMIASHFGRPRGLIGRLVGRVMARSNGDFNRWVVEELGKQYQGQPARIVELGPGPGVGLEAALRMFPNARLWGVDPSPEMLSQSRKRNLGDAESGRLTLLEGNVASLAELAPIDIVMANHVLYFWHHPSAELAQLHGFLRPGGLLAVGYQLRLNMPKPAQTNFPKLGHLLYDSEDAVTRLLREAGFTSVSLLMKGTPDAPGGRLALATA